jgi:hypothetical protein
MRSVISLLKVTKTIGASALGVTVTASRKVFWGDAAGRAWADTLSEDVEPVRGALSNA